MTVRPAPPGLQRERTALAWRRTAFAFAGNGLLLTRSADTWIVVGSFAVMAIAAGLAATSGITFRSRDTHGWIAGRKRRAAILVALAGGVGLLDVAAIVRWAS